MSEVLMWLWIIFGFPIRVLMAPVMLLLFMSISDFNRREIKDSFMLVYFFTVWGVLPLGG